MQPGSDEIISPTISANTYHFVKADGPVVINEKVDHCYNAVWSLWEWGNAHDVTHP